jgi:hypothetical protein
MRITATRWKSEPKSEPRTRHRKGAVLESV